LRGHKRSSSVSGGSNNEHWYQYSSTKLKRWQQTIFKEQKQKKPFTISYLAKACGIGRNFPLENMKKGHQALASTEKKPNPTQLCVIDCLKSTHIHFSARNLFIASRIEERTNEEKVFAFDTQSRTERFHLFVRKRKPSGSLPNLDSATSGRPS
jgi:hypothetical protein